jgi:hypothetical protein
MTSPATSSEPPRPLLDRSRRARGSPWPATTRSLPGRRRTSRPGTRSAGPPSGSVELEPISPIFLLGPLGLTVLRRPRAPYWWSLCRHRTPRRRSWTRWRGSARAGGICWRWPSTTRHTAGARPSRGRGGRGVPMERKRPTIGAPRVPTWPERGSARATRPRVDHRSVIRRPVRPWRRPAVAWSLRHGDSRFAGDEATDPGSSVCGREVPLAGLPGLRLPASASNSDASVPGRAAPRRNVLGSVVGVRPHGVRITGVGPTPRNACIARWPRGRARLPWLPGVRHPSPWVRQGPL